MKIKFEYRGGWLEHYDWTISLEELKEMSEYDYEEFEENIIDSADGGEREFGYGEHDIIKVYEEKTSIIPDQWKEINGKRIENPEWKSWRDTQGDSGFKVNFALDQDPNYSFLLDLKFKEICTKEDCSNLDENCEDTDGVGVYVEMFHYGVVRYLSVEIPDNEFNSELFTIKQHKNSLQDINLNFYYNNELLTVDCDYIESDCKATEWDINSRGKIDDDEVWNLIPEEEY